MTLLRRTLMAASAAGLLAGCAAQWDVDGVAAQAPQGDAFTKALHTRYVERATFERGEQDWDSVAFFVDRARAAAAGTAPAPAAPAEWGMGGAADLNAAHERVSAALKTNAPSQHPDACARAQTWYEHWVEQRGEGHQADHIATAQAAYEAAIAECLPAPEAKPAAAPAPAAPAPQSFIVHFPFDSTSLVGKAMGVLRDVVAALGTQGMSKVDVVGHTDSAGATAYNDALSRKRAEAVKGALVDLGAPAAAISTAAKGEGAPAVARGDGVAEPGNRRAEITVRP